MHGHAHVLPGGAGSEANILESPWMLTLAPLPSWQVMIRAMLRGSPSNSELAAPWCGEDDVAGLLSRSMWSLALIALWRKRQTAGSSITAWVPDFFCNSSLTALRRADTKCVFYPLTEEMTPDMDACRVLLKAAPPNIVLLVHYFGKPAPAAALRELCARSGAWLVEDAAHVLRPVGGVGAYGDFVLYSPHKHLAIPDGAVLIIRKGGPSRFSSELTTSFGSPESWPDQLTGLRRLLGGSPVNRIHPTLWLLKRLLQKLGVGRAARGLGQFSETVDSVSAGAPWIAPAPSALGRRLLAIQAESLADVASARERRQLLWDALLEAGPDCAQPPAVADRPAARDWTPYLASYRADAPSAEAIYNCWRSRGLPVTTWPDLPPEVLAGRDGRTRAAADLRHTRVYLSVHQSMNPSVMLQHAARLRAETPESDRPDLRWVWDATTESQWEKWLERAGRSSLPQAWAYGAAKADSSGWRVSRAVIYRDEEPIALVQVLQRRIAGLIKVARINRGPICLRPLQAAERRAIWERLARLGNLRRGRIVIVAPELGLDGQSVALLVRVGFRQFSPRAWESAWIDLGLESEVLRKRLSGKWRNMLVSAERAGLKLEKGSSEQLFGWMMDRYQDLLLEKDFTGVPIGVVVALRRHLNDQSRLMILRAMAEGEPVAGICLVCHGASATYLIGWNGHEGRALKANQYLLWQAILTLKERGIRWFDLGGISRDRNPGITAFKLGLNGERYELVGEHWKW